jgi:hypothetical protein
MDEIEDNLHKVQKSVLVEAISTEGRIAVVKLQTEK